MTAIVPGAGPSGSDAVVAEQHEALARDRRRQRAMRIGVDGRDRLARVDVGLLEQAQGELVPQDAPERVVERSGVRVAALERREQRFGEAVAGRKLDVDPGAEGHDGRLGLAAGEAVVRGELIDGEVVGDDGAVEAPRASQDPGEQVLVGGARHAVELVVAVHHRRQPCGADGRLERMEEDLAKLAVGHVRRRPVHAAFRRAVADEVLRRRDHARRQIRPLQPLDEGRPHACDEVRVLAVGLLGPSPARVAHDVEHGRQPLMGARLPHLDPDPVGHRSVQVRLEGAGDPDRLRVHRRATSHQAGADLLVDDGRDAQPRALDQPPLQLVGDARHLLGRQRARSGDARDLPETVPADRGGAVVVDLVAADELEHPRGAELRHLLLRQHARQQVFHPVLDREPGVAVRRVAIDDAGLDGHPLIAPVRPLTNWRSATR